MNTDNRNPLRELRQERHAAWYANNMAVLHAAGVPFTERATACLFRVKGKPMVDFYPHTGRWRVVSPGGRTFSGGAQKFLAWYAKQHE